ncbi:hypothetical protein FKP32DRAFT_18085 [Trametes sanguinea]|nr:hypothetical protein FKP32DRAFT_18085 [Trametes sanguinea]
MVGNPAPSLGRSSSRWSGALITPRAWSMAARRGFGFWKSWTCAEPPLPTLLSVARLTNSCLASTRTVLVICASEMITAEELACPLRLDLRDAHPTLPSCFSTLANFIADYFPGSAFGMPSFNVAAFTASKMAVFLMESTPSATSSILLAFMARMNHLPTGALGHRDCRSHDVCELLSALGRDAKEAERYYGFFLGCITRCWQDEIAERMGMPTSPMPWSVQSLQELSLPGETIFHDFTWREELLIPRMATSTGFVLHTLNEAYIDLAFPDIPWMGGQHDGYPVCTTLAHYVAMRRPPGAVRSLHDDAALWLSAMTFGLLEAVTRLRIPESTLLSVRQIEGQDGWETVVSGSRVRQLVSTWLGIHLRNYKDPDAHIAHGRAVIGLIRRAMQVLEEELPLEELNFFIPPGTAPDKSIEVYWGIAMMVIVLNHVVHDEDLTEWAATDIPELRNTNLLVEGSWPIWWQALYHWWKAKMCSAGWCPYTISGLPRNSYAHTILLPKLLQLRPFIRATVDEHAQCQDDSCRFYTLTASNPYGLRHADSCPSCEYAKPPLAEVLRLLSLGVIPVVTYDGEAIRVVSGAQTPYVAISHVWAEGMGSTTEDGLPTCVIKRLVRLVRDILPNNESAFWIDLLCVPADTEARRQAIRLMARTYQDAATVLVIDDCIRSLCTRQHSLEENLLRIATSAWMRRVWTLQEGLLARELCFEFVDGLWKTTDMELGNARAWQVSDIPGLAMEGTVIRSPYAVLTPLLSIRSARRFRSSETLLPEMGILDVTWMMHGRTTSKLADEVIAIAGLMPLSVSMDRLLEITDGPDLAEQRMKSFLVQVENLPFAVAFGTSPRLTLPGFTWAPRSLGQGSVHEWQGTRWPADSALCTEDGLLANSPMAYLRTSFSPPLALATIHHRASNTAWQFRPVSGTLLPSSANALVFRQYWDTLPSDDSLADVGHVLHCLAVQTQGRCRRIRSTRGWTITRFSPPSQVRCPVPDAQARSILGETSAG